MALAPTMLYTYIASKLQSYISQAKVLLFVGVEVAIVPLLFGNTMWLCIQVAL